MLPMMANIEELKEVDLQDSSKQCTFWSCRQDDQKQLRINCFDDDNDGCNDNYEDNYGNFDDNYDKNY